MDPVTIIGLISALGPFVITGIKKVFKTDKLSEEKKVAVNTMLPLAVGIVASIVACAAGQCDPSTMTCPKDVSWITCIITGMCGGAGANYVRNFDKNVLGIATNVTNLVVKKDPPAEPPAS